MRRVTVNGKSYSLPYEKLFRSLTDSERNSLKASIGLYGIQQPAIVGTTPTHGRIVIDGINRIDLGHETNPEREIPVEDRGEITDLAAEALALTLNVDRRQLTPEDIASFQVKQEAKAKQLRAEGASWNEIVKETGLKRTTARYMLGAPGGTGNTGVRIRTAAPEPDDADEDDYPPPRQQSTRYTEPLEPAPDVSGYQPANLAERAGERELERLRKALLAVNASLCAFIGLNAPQWPAVRSALKRLGIEVKPGRGPRPATCPALEGLVEELAGVGKVEV